MRRKAEIISELKAGIKELVPVDKVNFISGQALRNSETIKYFPHIEPDVVIDFFFSNCLIRLFGEVVSARGSAVLRNKIHQLKSFKYKHNEKPVIIADYLSKNQRRICRDEEVFYLDLVGNVFIHHNSIYIDKISLEKFRPSEQKERNPFSDKASLLLREMMEAPAETFRRKDIAEDTGLSRGYVSKVSKRLEELSYIEINSSGMIRLKNAGDILNDWTQAYSYRKNQQLKYFCLAKDPEEILSKLRNTNIPRRVQYALALQAGANLVTPYAVYNEVHIYVPDQNAINFLTKSLKLKEAQQGANIIFLLPYYKHSVFYNKQKIRGLWVTSDIQLYLDLYNYPVRGLEQAEHLYEKRLKKLIKS